MRRKTLTPDQSAESTIDILLGDLERIIVENMNKPKQQHDQHCFAWANSANNSQEWIRRINLITN